MNTTLIVMAAGIGSRFGGGIKQLAAAGPNGEILMDYSVFDACRAGFNKVVFVIRKDIEKEFHEVIGKRIGEKVNVSYVFQERDDLPDGFTCPHERTKPWGTGQAILACKDEVKEPFAVINADDFYGHRSYELLHRYLTEEIDKANGKENICLAGYILENTLSENGGVTRGVCQTDDQNRLLSILETKNIHRVADGKIVAPTENGEKVLEADCKVSMNMWGLQPSFFSLLEEGFRAFLSTREEGDITSEFLLPIFINQLIAEEKAECRLLPTEDKWFGLTYKEDLPTVRDAVSALIEKKTYPDRL